VFILVKVVLKEFLNYVEEKSAIFYEEDSNRTASIKKIYSDKNANMQTYSIKKTI